MALMSVEAAVVLTFGLVCLTGALKVPPDHMLLSRDTFLYHVAHTEEFVGIYCLEYHQGEVVDDSERFKCAHKARVRWANIGPPYYDSTIRHSSALRLPWSSNMPEICEKNNNLEFVFEASAGGFAKLRMVTNMTRVDRFLSTHPECYIIQHVCYEDDMGNCPIVYLFILIKRELVVGNDLDLSIVPWGDVNYLTERVFSIRFGKERLCPFLPLLQYAFVGEDCEEPDLDTSQPAPPPTTTTPSPGPGSGNALFDLLLSIFNQQNPRFPGK